MKVTWLSMGLLLGLVGCGADTPELTLTTPDRMRFDTEIFPVLLRDCGFDACHASANRFFQVFGPGRARLVPGTSAIDPTTPLEYAHAYERARSMIDAAEPERSLLLRKPLATMAGGTGHEGVDEHGRNVYQSKIEPGYLVLQRWVLGQPAAPQQQP